MLQVLHFEEQLAAILWKQAGDRLQWCPQHHGTNSLIGIENVGVVEHRSGLRFCRSGFQVTDAPVTQSRPRSVQPDNRKPVDPVQPASELTLNTPAPRMASCFKASNALFASCKAKTCVWVRMGISAATRRKSIPS